MYHSTCFLGSVTVWCLLRHWGSHWSPVTVLPSATGIWWVCKLSFSDHPPPLCLSERHRQNCALWSFLRCLGVDSSCHHLYSLSPCHSDTGTPLRLTSCIVSSRSGAFSPTGLLYAQIPKSIWDSLPLTPSQEFWPWWWWLEGRVSFQRPTPSNSMAFSHILHFSLPYKL